MNVEFYSSHIDTLADLIKLAEKHNCRINFGTYTSTEREIDEDILKKHKITDELLEEMKIKMTINNSLSSFDKVWFELYDKNTNTYNTMTYIESSTYFIVEKLREFEFRFEEDEPSEQLIEWLEENDENWDYEAYTLHLQNNPTIICGFGNNRVEDYRVYRSGMALAFFSDLVCDYLKEPRINRVY